MPSSSSPRRRNTAPASPYGLKINHAEHPLAFIEMLRRIVEHAITPEEAVRADHGVLQSTGITPLRRLEDDLQLTSGITSYGGTGSTIVKPAGAPVSGKPAANADANPTGDPVSRARVEAQLARLRKRFGESLGRPRLAGAMQSVVTCRHITLFPDQIS